MNHNSTNHQQPQQHQHQPNDHHNQVPGFITGVPCPKYIRSITFQNLSEVPLQITTSYQSNSQQVHNLAGKSTLKIEKQIQKQTYTLCDPIQNFRMIAQDGRVVVEGCNNEAQGIQARHYIINQDLTCSRKSD